MNDAQRYKLIKDAITLQQSKGVSDISGGFGVYMCLRHARNGRIYRTIQFSVPNKREACALGCLLKSHPKFTGGKLDLWYAAAEVLGQGDNAEFANGITDGFDNAGCHPDSTSRQKAGFHVGARLRRQ